MSHFGSSVPLIGVLKPAPPVVRMTPDGEKVAYQAVVLSDECFNALVQAITANVVANVMNNLLKILGGNK